MGKKSETLYSTGDRAMRKYIGIYLELAKKSKGFTDFVIPDGHKPMAFVEVRKSSSRHASLYAKDKMFSAINWKGENRELLAVLVVDGPWTRQTLSVMAKVFDYIVPISLVSDVAEVISAYIKGDRSKLKWLADFAIHPAGQ